MKVKQILENVAMTLSAVKLGGKKSDPKLAALDRGVLTVALLLAALDGTILPEEYAAFERLAKKCRGGSAKNVRQLLDAALRSAGYLMAMAQVGTYTEKERLAAFVASATEALPGGFADGSPVDVRRAFALWVAMGVSDGAFSEVERAAIEALAELFTCLKRARVRGQVARVAQSVPLARADLEKVLLVDEAAVLEPDFLLKAEQIVRDLAVPAKRERAEAALGALLIAKNPAK